MKFERSHCLLGLGLLCAWSAAPVRAAAFDDREVQVNLGIEAANQTENPLAVVATLSTPNVRSFGDLLSADIRVGRDRRMGGLQYDMPTTRFGASTLSLRAEYLDDALAGGPPNYARYSAATTRALYCGGERPVLFCAGLGVRRTEYLSAESSDGAGGARSTTVPFVSATWGRNAVRGPIEFPTGSNTVAGLDVTPTRRRGAYARASLRHTHFVLPEDFPLRLRLRGEVAVARGLGGELPMEQQLFAGGFDSVRGYGYRAVAPINSSGQLQGGARRIVASAEVLAKPVHVGGVGLVGSVFYDHAKVSKGDPALANAIARSYGAALSMPFKGGVVQLSVARPLDRQFDAQRFQIEVRANW